MKLEQQVTSLEISKRLKELGVKQESLFGWVNEFQVPREDKWFVTGDKTEYQFTCSAFTVSELGEMLNNTTRQHLMLAYGQIFNVPGTQFITPEGLQACMQNPDIGGRMLIYLLENKLITL